ncbi:MAG: DNA repair protein RadC [Nitrospirae bacterium]|jgi:DNA repair protein RadC|nr:DNA repair protein RadC [Nitrospirota bacterium]
MSYQSIKKWPEGERPRERLLKYGAHNLSEAQLLAIILRTGGGSKSAIDLAIELLNSFGDLKSIEDASAGEFSSFKGMGSAKIAQLKAAFELGRRLLETPRKRGPVFSSGHDVYSYYHQRLKDLKKEEFRCAMLDAKNRILRDCRISEGTLTNSLIHPREAFRYAIKESAASVIFVHNHPSGDPGPSREDIVITERLVNAGDLIGIKVLDHVIIGDNKYTSMMEKGYIK